MSSKPSSSQKSHVPTRNDVRLVRRMLMTHLPLELADEILEDAMYWPIAISASTHEPITLHPALSIDNDVSRCCLVTPPLPGSSEMAGERGGIPKAARVGMIRFKIDGYEEVERSGVRVNRRTKGPYGDAWSWFEAIILRPTSHGGVEDQGGEAVDTFFLEFTRGRLALPSEDDLQDFGFTYVAPSTDGSPRWMLQRNARIDEGASIHEITWTTHGASGDAGSGDGAGFVSALRPGDKVAVVARARFPSWANFVESVQVDIYCAV